MRKDIIKISLSVIVIQLMIAFVFGAINLNQNATSTEIDATLQETISVTQQNTEDFAQNGTIKTGACVSNTPQDICVANGCEWDSDNLICKSKIGREKSIDFSVFDIFSGLFNVANYVWLVIKLIGMTIFIQIVIATKLNPYISNFMIKFFVNIIFLGYQVFFLYHLYAFISNWRGIANEN